MNSLSKNYWESIYSSNKSQYPNYDGWLDKYLSKLCSANNIVDLGCGNGVNALYLNDNKINVIACDFSESALEQIKKRNSEIQVMCFDMTTDLPFEKASMDFIVADLSLHYFEWNVTRKIVEEIFRVLNRNGVLLCRVNSTKEYHPTKNDEMIEPGYYFNGENYKRYFTKKDIESLFSNYRIKHITEDITEKYGSKKYVWEIAVTKLKN